MSKHNFKSFKNIASYLVFIVIAFSFIGLSYAQEGTPDKNYEPVTSPRCNEFTFDATASYDPDKNKISFIWDFGDGDMSYDPIVTHTYTESGDYKVTLTVTDGSESKCSTSTKTQYIRANIPPKSTFNSPENACVESNVTFDASASYDDSGRPLDYRWNFGDGTKARGKKIVDKVYDKGGSYKASLTVDDSMSTMCSTSVFEKIINVNAPPKADAGNDTILKCVNADEPIIVDFNGDKTTDINNDKLEYLWDFGDGTKQTGRRVSHSYNKIGTYDAKLIVKDDSGLDCDTGIDFVTVQINERPKAIAGENISACIGEDVLFDGTKSYTNIKGTLSAKWFFGDGESSDAIKTSHTYKKPGKYDATLQVENELNSACPPSKDTKTVIVNTPPSVSMKANNAACLGETVYFDASSANDPDGDSLEYYWSFGDGTILKSGPKVAHDYKQGGNFRVSVVVDDGKSSPCSTATDSMNVKINTPPVADAGPNLTCCSDVKTEFDASSSSDPDGDELTYTWDFGDGTKTRGMKVSHTYKKPGSYNVFLTVDDNSNTSCSKASTGFIAEAKSKPVPVMSIR